MKKFFTYILALVALAACTNDDSIVGLNNNVNPVQDSIPYNVTEEDVVGIRVEIDDPKKVGDDDMSRASLVYDDDRKVMTFKWANDDVIGVFTYPDAAHSSEQKFTQVHNEFDTDLFRTFETPEHSLTVDPEKVYLACFPWFETHQTNYSNIPVSYLGQIQSAPVNFSNYYNNKKDVTYKASQELASAHLPNYDFLCTGPTKPGSTGQIYFHLNRMGVIVRFWIKIGSGKGDGTEQKDNYVYDELQLVNSTKMFTTEALMDAAAMTLTPTAQSHVVTLKLGTSGFDMTEQANNGTISTSPFYDYYKNKYTGYIMAYMMLAPIDLKGTSDDPMNPGYVEKSILYLVAHESGSLENKHYYKAILSTKPDLKANDYFQWSPAPDVDEPITFSEITVEEWREGTSIDNDGMGTGTW